MNIYELLNKLEISYQEVNHPKAYTVKEIQNLHLKIKGIGCKNLFLKDKNSTYYLIVLEENKRANMKDLEKLLKTSKLSFASEKELQDILKVEKGSVTPLAIINDEKNLVTLLIDKELENKTLLVHPNTNDKTISITYEDLLKFIRFTHHSVKSF